VRGHDGDEVPAPGRRRRRAGNDDSPDPGARADSDPTPKRDVKAEGAGPVIPREGSSMPAGREAAKDVDDSWENEDVDVEEEEQDQTAIASASSTGSRARDVDDEDRDLSEDVDLPDDAEDGDRDSESVPRPETDPPLSGKSFDRSSPSPVPPAASGEERPSYYRSGLARYRERIRRRLPRLNAGPTPPLRGPSSAEGGADDRPREERSRQETRPSDPTPPEPRGVERERTPPPQLPAPPPAAIEPPKPAGPRVLEPARAESILRPLPSPPTAVRSLEAASANVQRTSPFVVACGEDCFRVFDEALRHTGFFDALERRLGESKKRRENFEIAAMVDFLNATRREEAPVSYVDPKLVNYLFNRLLDSGFRILRVVETRNELTRLCRNRSPKVAGNALGFDESCYEIRDLGDDLFPMNFGEAGKKATGRGWKDADFRIVFAKNRIDLLFGPTMVFYNLLSTLAVPPLLVALEQGLDPAAFVLGSFKELPVHYALVDAFNSMDGTFSAAGLYELIRDADGNVPGGPDYVRTNTIIAGQDLLAVEYAGHKLQGLDPLEDKWIMPRLRRASGYRPPAEIDNLPVFPGWRGYGNKLRSALEGNRPMDLYKVGLWLQFCQSDPVAFPPQAGGYMHARLLKSYEQCLAQVKRARGDTVPNVIEV